MREEENHTIAYIPSLVSMEINENLMSLISLEELEATIF